MNILREILGTIFVVPATILLVIGMLILHGYDITYKKVAQMSDALNGTNFNK